MPPSEGHGDWKTVVILREKLRVLIVVGPGHKLSVDPFHEHVRRERLGKWLRKGLGKVQRVGKMLCPSLDVSVVPSEKMTKVTDRAASASGTSAASLKNHATLYTMGSVAWLLVYLLLPACKANPKVRCRPDVAKRAFELLQTLAKLACEALSIMSNAAGSIEAKCGGTACVRRDSSVELDEEWVTWQKCCEDDLREHMCKDIAGKCDVCLASMLWFWSQACMTDRPRRSKHEWQDVAAGISLACLRLLASGLALWASREAEPSTAMLVALQPARKRTNPALLQRLQTKGNKRRAARSWRDDGLRKKLCIQSAESRSSSKYLWSLRRLTSEGPLVVELLFDSTHFATKDTQVTIAYLPVHKMAAYLPPVVLRHLRWRKGLAGETVTEGDRAKLQQSGLRAEKGMESFDALRYLNHVLHVGFGKSLMNFMCPSHLAAMEPGSCRYWSQARGRWMRISHASSQHLASKLRDPANHASDSGMESDLGVMELPDSLLDPDGQNILLLCLDQKQSQWTAAHFLLDPNGLGLLAVFRSDGYHRSWRDFVHAMSHSHGSFNHTAVQLNFAFNVNYQPCGSGAHFQKKREVKMDWREMYPRPLDSGTGVPFDEWTHNMALDARVQPPRTSRDVQWFYKTYVLEDRSYDVKGDFMKQASWYSILKMIREHDSAWHARKYLAENIADSFAKGPDEKKKVEAVAQEVVQFMSTLPSGPGGGGDKATYLEEVRRLRKKAGNALLLAPRLMHFHNLVNARLMLLVGQVAWTEQSFWALEKSTPEADRNLMVQYAKGLGEAMLKKMWRSALFNSEE